MPAPVKFSVQVKPAPDHRLSGWYQAEATADGLRLSRNKKAITLPVGSRAEYKSGHSLRVEHDGAWVELSVAKLGTHTDTLARDLAAFLAGEKPLPAARDYQFPWYIWVLCFLPMGIPAVARGGAIWAALGFGLASLCFTIAGRSRWPVPLRVVLMTLASGVGYAILGVVIIFLQVGLLGPKNPPAVLPPQVPSRPVVPQPHFDGQRFEVAVEGFVTHLQYTPDGRTLLILGGDDQLGTVNTETGAPTAPWFPVRDLIGNVRSVDVSPDGKRAVVCGYKRIGPVVLDLDARTVLARCEVTANEVRDEVVPARDVAFADGGAKVLAVAGDKLIEWDAATGRRVREMASPAVIASQPNSLFELYVRQNGRLVVTGGQHTSALKPGQLEPFRLDQVWSLDAGKPERELNFTAPKSLRPGVKDAVRQPARPHTEARQLHISADGRYALVGRPDGVLAMDLAAGKQLPDLPVEIKTHTGFVLPVAFAADGAAFAVIKPDGEIDFYRLPDLERIGSLWSSGDGRVYSLAFAPDGKHLAVQLLTANRKGSKVVVIDLEKAVEGWTPRPAAGR